MEWTSCGKVLVTGGASFIGSHLVEKLVERGADVRVADNLSSGKLENLDAVRDRIEFMQGDLKHFDFATDASSGCNVVFHLAADHGGRGYIASHPADCATNMALDNIVFETARRNAVERITFASSACVYPTHLQQKDKIRLREDMVSFDEPGKAFADECYGWAKLMGEMSLKAIHRQYGVKTASVRIFTAYGPRENETHAIVALIAKAFIRQSPFEVWGDGEQTRNFTYVQDTVAGLIAACEHIEDGTAVNAGIEDFISINEACEEVFGQMDWRPPDGIKYQTDKPVGVKHRAADASFALQRTGWRPSYTFEQGLRQTIDWYTSTHTEEKVAENLGLLLTQR